MQNLLKIYPTLQDTKNLLFSLRDEELHSDTLKLIDHGVVQLWDRIIEIERVAYERVTALVSSHGADQVIEQADLVDLIREGDTDEELNPTMADEITLLVEMFGTSCICEWADIAEQENRDKFTKLLGMPHVSEMDPAHASIFRKLFGVK